MRLSIALSILLAFCTSLYAQPAAAPAKSAEQQIAEPREQTMAGFDFCYASKRTNLANVKQTIDELMPKLDKVIRNSEVKSTGAIIFIYLGTMEEFELQVGTVVEEGAKAPTGFQIRKVEPFRCVTTLYSGPMASIGQAYQQLMGEASKGRQPTPEWRESYLYWEGDDSPNNITHIQVGIK